MKKKIIITISIVLALAILAGGAYYYRAKKTSTNPTVNSDSALTALAEKYPTLVESVKQVESEQAKMASDPTNIQYHFGLGMAWKGLADRVHDLKLPEYKDYYQKALDVYVDGINLTQRKNTILLINAGNMQKYMDNYETAEEYYKEAIAVSPGDASNYIVLTDLYENYLKKSEAEIIAVFEEGEKRVLNPTFLETYKKQYLGRIK